MNTAKYLVATGAIAALLAATPALADNGRDGGNHLNIGTAVNGFFGINRDNDNNDGDNHGASVSAVARSDAGKSDSDNEKNHGAVVSFFAHLNKDKDKDNDNDNDDNHHATTTRPIATTTKQAFVQRFLDRIGAATAGVVTSVGNGTFTIAPFNNKTGTTTVTNNASTTFRVNGLPSASSSLAVGEKVIVTGTTSTTTGAVGASIVDIITHGLLFLRNLFLHV